MILFKQIDRRHRITLGVRKADIPGILDEWLHRGAPCELRVCRAKTQGLFCIVAELVPSSAPEALFWLSWCVERNSCKVAIKEL